MSEIWLTCFSAKSWLDPEKWEEYLVAVEVILGDKLEKLDVHDPIRRKTSGTRGEGAYITNFSDVDEYRWLLGMFSKSRISFEIWHFRQCGGRPNSISFYVPQKWCTEKNVARLVKLFNTTNESLDIFYGYSDSRSAICQKKPSTPSLDLSVELLGAFWLTYFGAAYSSYFSMDRLQKITGARQVGTGGVTIQLAEDSSDVSDGQRNDTELMIGARSFAGHGKDKFRGQYALTAEQLTNWVSPTNQ